MAWAHARGVRHLINDAGNPIQIAYIEFVVAPGTIASLYV